jgi:hypothetical protein
MDSRNGVAVSDRDLLRQDQAGEMGKPGETNHYTGVGSKKK